VSKPSVICLHLQSNGASVVFDMVHTRALWAQKFVTRPVPVTREAYPYTYSTCDQKSYPTRGYTCTCSVSDTAACFKWLSL